MSRIFLLSLSALLLMASACNQSTQEPTQTPTTPTSSPASSPASSPGSSPASAPRSAPGSAPGSAPSSSSASAPATNGPLRAVGEKKKYKVDLKLVPENPGVGELFVVETRVTDATTNKPVEKAQFKLDASMPEHHHGMMTKPLHKETAPGVYTSEGFKFHMAGRWEFRADIHANDTDDVVRLDYHQSALAGDRVKPGKNESKAKP